MAEMIEQWRDPVFNDPHHCVPVVLAERLTEMADELTAGENITEAIAAARIPDAPEDLPVTPLRHAMLPRSLRIFYERMHALVAVAGTAREADAGTFAAELAPSEAEQRLGFVIGQAFHQGCQLTDVALAAGLPEDQVIAIGKRTIRRTGWLERL